jgi:hypothetical protein
MVIIITVKTMPLVTIPEGTKKIYAPSSSLLQGKHLPFTPSPLRLNIFRLFMILALVSFQKYMPPPLPYLSNSSEGGPVGIFKKGSQISEKY